MENVKHFIQWSLLALAGFSPLSSANETVLPNNDSYTLFESGQVRPLALSPDGDRLYAVNTPDNRLEVFDTSGRHLRHCGSLSVGLEPVAVAVRRPGEVWVVNHLSDSVSVVRIASQVCKNNNSKRVGRIIRTLLVGDEPRDIVFAGPAGKRAFITTAHRGQNAPYDPQLSTPGVGRADVWVFDADNPGSSMQGDPLNIITLFTNTPRALAVSADGRQVYAAGFNTGNQTTTLHERTVTENGGLPGPHTNIDGMPQPETGLIVKFNGEHWVDEIGRHWDDQVKFSLPDKDVFVIDAMASPPVAVAGEQGFYQGVGSTIFNMLVNPANGHVYVANLAANNEKRFEGTGITAGQTLRGHFIENHITVIKDGEVLPRHLNKHIDYAQCCAPIPNDENDRSLAFPMDMAISNNGDTLYVTAFGSSKLGVFDTAALEDDSFVPGQNNHVELSGGGPSGVVLDEKRGRLYVLTRFDNAVSVVDTDKLEETQHLAMYNPEPPHVISGRRFLYDARYTSSHGDSACAACHIFGDMDHLAWDLGNPDGSELNNPSPILVSPEQVGFDHISIHFRPMKGPMTTQSLRGMDNHGSLHWRGDKTGGNDEPTFQPNSGVYNEDAAFKQFNGAFEGLLGRHQVLSEEEMQAFADFSMEIMYPPNPIRKLDNSLTESQQAGRDFFFGGLADPFNSCVGCHITDRNGNAEYGVKKPGFFGADGRATFTLEPQIFKIPHLRNMYQKVGMFGMARTDGFILPESDDPGVDNAFMGDQVNGFGFFHDGSVDSVFRFINIVFFQHAEQGPFPNPGGFAVGPEGDVQRRQVEAYVMASETNFAPIVGQQVTLTSTNAAIVAPRIQLMMERAELGECDLVAKQHKADREHGYLYQGGGMFKADSRKHGPLSDASLRLQLKLKRHSSITYTCVPPASGVRIALDRDENGVLNGDQERTRHDDENEHHHRAGGLPGWLRAWLANL
jgi:DNA-binding beta-propeller fold protein YncE